MGTWPKLAAQLEPRSDGMIVALSRLSGLTSSSVLQAPFYFQVAPLDSMPQEYAWEWNDFRTIDGSMHSNPQGRTLPSWSFSSFFTDDRTSDFLLIRDVHVLTMIRTLKKIGDSMRPFQLQFGQPRLWGTWDVVAAVTMRGLHVEERAGEPDARYFTVTFSEYADADPGKAVAAPKPITNAAAASKAGQDHPNIIVTLDSARLPSNGRTFAQIAKHYYGDPSQWYAIARASGLTNISANTDLVVTVGHRKPPPKIIVPRLSSLKTAATSGGGGAGRSFTS